MTRSSAADEFDSGFASSGGLDGRRTPAITAFLLVLSTLVTTCILAGSATDSSALQVVQTSPARNALAPVSTAISIRFDEPIDLASVDSNSFRVFGKRSGPLLGTFALAADGVTMTLLPDRELGYGEGVIVNLSHDLAAVDGSLLRAAGYAFGFRTEVLPSSRVYTEIDILSNRIDGEQTRIYGAAAMDWNRDGYTDLATINEVSADVRVALNTADGSGLFQPFLDPHPIGVEASPNEPADFDNDGIADLCTAAVYTGDVWILRGLGDGTFATSQSIAVGNNPHGIMPIDVDGDGDSDIVNANNGSNNLSLMINNGSGVFGAPTFFDGGVNGEYGLAVGDMNNDGISDLVVASQQGSEIRTLLGNGNGTFTPTAGGPQSSGGFTWVVVVDDVNGDGNLDASTANSASGNSAMLMGLGNGRFGSPFTVNIGAHTVATDLGDADGDGDIDWMVSSFGGGFWRLYENTGGGNFVFDQQFNAPANPSCAIFLDFDSDGDLDFGLTDEIADVIVLMRNGGPASDVGEVADETARLSNHPDPFVQETRIRYESPARGTGLLTVFDPAGRRVAQRDLTAAAGMNETVFDGRSDSGSFLESGVYLYKVRIGSAEHAGRMTILR